MDLSTTVSVRLDGELPPLTVHRYHTDVEGWGEQTSVHLHDSMRGLTLYRTGSPADLAARLRELADAIEAAYVLDRRQPADATAGVVS
ncbi:hypothetical protein [Euzebya rosea]|uniref:hypothetical protein n=1 Tax=Euzebya rosea TaxID=2052804 RepID=UPI0013002279|nr:hypothetical protein [Euzebya rosea]